MLRKGLVRTVKLANESLRQPEVQAMARTLLGPHFARFGGEGLLEEILRAANDTERPEAAPSHPTPPSPPIGAPPPASPATPASPIPSA
jgi:hypothetical protein